MISMVIIKQKECMNFKTVYLIGEEGCKWQEFLKTINLQVREELSWETPQLYVSNYASKKEALQVYAFPTDRAIRPYLSLYLHVLEKPDLLIFFLAPDLSNNRELLEWIDLFVQVDEGYLMVFFSQAKTYADRQQTISRLAGLFSRDIIDCIFFPNIQPGAVPSCLCNLGQVGISLSHYIRKVSFISSFKWMIKNVSKYFTRKRQQSII